MSVAPLAALPISFTWMPSVRPLLIAGTVALLSMGSAHAQGASRDPQVAMVTRMCLWNADKAMWSRLGLRKDQIRKMQAIRERYPAVVEGQWIMGDTVQAPGPGPVTASVAVTPSVQPAKGSTPPGLQAEVRAVLSPAQVNKWMALCTGVAER